MPGENKKKNACRWWFMQHTKAGSPDMTDISLKGETTLLDPRWPHGSSTHVAQETLSLAKSWG
jgi:hypothetical protein